MTKIAIGLGVIAAGVLVWRSLEKSLAAHLMDDPPVHGLSDFDA